MKKVFTTVTALALSMIMIGCTDYETVSPLNGIEHEEKTEVKESGLPEIEPVTKVEIEEESKNVESNEDFQEELQKEDVDSEVSNGVSEEDISFIAEHTFFRIIEYLGNGQFKCNVSIELAFRKDDVENAQIGDTITSLAGIEYKVMEAAREYGSESPLVGEWWSDGLCAEIGIDERNPIVLIDSYYCGRYQINGRAIIENETEKVLTLDPDAIITGYDNNSVSGSDFISYFEGNTDIGLIYSPSGLVKATVNDDVISKMVFIWEG